MRLLANVGAVHGEAKPHRGASRFALGANLCGRIQHRVEPILSARGRDDRGRGDEYGRTRAGASQRRRVLVVDRLVHPLFPRPLRIGAWPPRQPGEVLFFGRFRLALNAMADRVEERVALGTGQFEERVQFAGGVDRRHDDAPACRPAGSQGCPSIRPVRGPFRCRAVARTRPSRLRPRRVEQLNGLGSRRSAVGRHLDGGVYEIAKASRPRTGSSRPTFDPLQPIMRGRR